MERKQHGRPIELIREAGDLLAARSSQVSNCPSLTSFELPPEPNDPNDLSWCQIIPMRLAGHLVLLLAAILATGCGKRTVKIGPDSGAWVDEFVRQGCYDCLLDARKAYEQLAVKSAAACRGFRDGLLLALRRKAVDRPTPPCPTRALVPRLATLQPTELAIVRAIPEDVGSRRLLPPTKEGVITRLDADRHRHEPVQHGVQELSEAVAPMRAAFARAELRRASRVAANPPAAAPADDVPISDLQAGDLREPVRADRLAAVRTGCRDSSRASFFLGRVAMGTLFERTEPGPHSVRACVRTLSNSPTIAFDLGP